MKILVTGGAGFIGSHIVDAYLKLGHEVVVIDNLSTGLEANLNPAAKFYLSDINDESIIDIFKSEKFDLVNHQAAQIDVRVSVGAPRFDAMTNVMGSLNIYEAAMASSVKKIIFASSGGAIYGEQFNFPALEDDYLRPCSPYGISKLVNEKYLYYYKEVHGIDYVALRYANVYGPRQNFRGEAGVVAIFIQKMLTGEQPVINGDGLNSRDYVFIADVIKANILALGDKISGIYNIGTGVEKDVNFIFNTLKSQLGNDCPEIHAEPKSGEQRRSVISYEKIQKLHGWKPDYSIEEGLKLTVESFRRAAK
jgi:UDP-glucose 4-epimerase